MKARGVSESAAFKAATDRAMSRGAAQYWHRKGKEIIQAKNAALRPLEDAVRPLHDAVRPLANAVGPLANAVRPLHDAVGPLVNAFRTVHAASLRLELLITRGR